MPTQTIHSDRLDKNPLTISIFLFYLIWIKELNIWYLKPNQQPFFSVNDIKHMYFTYVSVTLYRPSIHVYGIA